MSWLYEHMQQSGTIGWQICGLGVLGVCAAITVVISAALGFKYLREVGLVSLGVATLCAGLGLGGMYVARSTTDEAISTGASSRTHGIRVRRMGYQEARSPAVLGLTGSALPLVAGALATTVGAARRRKRRNVDAKKARAAGRAVPLGLFAVALLTTGAAAAGVLQPLHGPDLDRRDPAWVVMEAIDIVERGKLWEGCAVLARAGHHPESPDGGGDLSKVGGYDDAVAKCVDFRMSRALKLEGPARRRALTTLKAGEGRLVPDEAPRQRIDAELAKLPASEETPQ
jgi:hypothetical protein